MKQVKGEKSWDAHQTAAGHLAPNHQIKTLRGSVR